MLPEHFYFTGTGWLGYIVYIPIGLALLTGLYLLLLRRITSIALRFISLVVLSVILLTWPLWGALALSYEAESLCNEQGGLHVYKTVEADGFLGGWGIETAAKHGFSYVESGGGKHMNRWTMVDGEPVRESITEFKSHYQVGVGGSEERINLRIRRARSASVKNRLTGEMIGELIIFKIYPSWFDIFILSLSPVEYNPWICGKEAPKQERYNDKLNKKYRYTFSDLIKATLKPKPRYKGEEE